MKIPRAPPLKNMLRTEHFRKGRSCATSARPDSGDKAFARYRQLGSPPAASTTDKPDRNSRFLAQEVQQVSQGEGAQVLNNEKRRFNKISWIFDFSDFGDFTEKSTKNRDLKLIFRPFRTKITKIIPRHKINKILQSF